jgi:hypothetical protein
VAEKSLLQSRAFLFLIFPVGVFTVFRIHDIFGEDPPYLDSDLSIFIIDLQDAN